MTVARDGDVQGNTCPKGAEYSRRELSSPMRLFTGTVKLEGDSSGRVLLPVKTRGPVPKSSLALVAHATRRIVANAPLRVGDVVCEDVAGTGVALVACADCDELSSRQAVDGR